MPRPCSWPLVAALLALLLPALLAACAAPLKVRADHDPGVRFDGWTAWSFAPLREDATTRMDDEFHRTVRGAVAESLTARGFPLVAGEPAQFIVVYHGQLSRRIGFSGFLDLHASSPWLNAYSHQPGWRLRRSLVRRYKHATILIDLVDATTGHIVWRGFATRDDEEPATPELALEALREEVREILALFPPKAG